MARRSDKRVRKRRGEIIWIFITTLSWRLAEVSGSWRFRGVWGWGEGAVLSHRPEQLFSDLNFAVKVFLESVSPLIKRIRPGTECVARNLPAGASWNWTPG